MFVATGLDQLHSREASEAIALSLLRDGISYSKPPVPDLQLNVPCCGTSGTGALSARGSVQRDAHSFGTPADPEFWRSSSTSELLSPGSEYSDLSLKVIVFPSGVVPVCTVSFTRLDKYSSASALATLSISVYRGYLCSSG